MYRKLVGLLVAALAVTLLMPLSAGATKPTTETSSFENEGIVIANGCGEGVDIVFSSKGELARTDFVDADGDRIRTQTQAALEVTLSLSTTDEVLELKARYRVDIDQVTGQRDFTGLLFRANVAGEGGVFRDIGRQVFDASNELIFGAGPDAPVNSFDFACEYLG